MIMPPALRKLALTVHITASVGWLGAVASYLALAIAGLVSTNPEVVRAAYISMDVTARYVIVPLSITGLITGLVQSFGTTWGLFRHYWVLAKLVLTVIGTFLLIAHTEPIGFMASVAMATPLSLADFRDFRTQLMLDSAAALLLLLVITVLSVFKPRGLTPYGKRKQREQLGAVQGRPAVK